MDIKLGRVLTLGKRFNMLAIKSPPNSCVKNILEKQYSMEISSKLMVLNYTE